MKVGVNLIFLGERAGGVGRYATELLGALAAGHPELELHAFTSRDKPAGLRSCGAFATRLTCRLLMGRRRRLTIRGSEDQRLKLAW